LKRRALERRIVASVEPSPLTPEEVKREFLALTDGGARIRCVGSARRAPKRLLSLGYVPRYKLELFNVTYYVCDVRQNEDVRFFVAYLALRESARGRPNFLVIENGGEFAGQLPGREERRPIDIVDQLGNRIIA